MYLGDYLIMTKAVKIQSSRDTTKIQPWDFSAFMNGSAGCSRSF